MICYTCPSEYCFLESEREKWEDVYSSLEKTNVRLVCVDKEIEFKNKYIAGKSIYVQRNQAMIDASDFCIFYYDKDYQPPPRKYSNRCVSSCQPKSGTSLAFKYASQKNKFIFNLYNKE